MRILSIALKVNPSLIFFTSISSLIKECKLHTLLLLNRNRLQNASSEYSIALSLSLTSYFLLVVCSSKIWASIWAISFSIDSFNAKNWSIFLIFWRDSDFICKLLSELTFHVRNCKLFKEHIATDSECDFAHVYTIAHNRFYTFQTKNNKERMCCSVCVSHSLYCLDETMPNVWVWLDIIQHYFVCHRIFFLAFFVLSAWIRLFAVQSS